MSISTMTREALGYSLSMTYFSGWGNSWRYLDVKTAKDLQEEYKRPSVSLLHSVYQHSVTTYNFGLFLIAQILQCVLARALLHLFWLLVLSVAHAIPIEAPTGVVAREETLVARASNLLEARRHGHHGGDDGGRDRDDHNKRDLSARRHGGDDDGGKNQDDDHDKRELSARRHGDDDGGKDGDDDHDKRELFARRHGDNDGGKDGDDDHDKRELSARRHGGDDNGGKDRDRDDDHDRRQFLNV